MNSPSESTGTAALQQLIEQQDSHLREIRRELHQNPEPSGAEFETSQFLFERLIEAGLKPRLGPEQRGLIVDLDPESSPKIALRADIDALRIQDEKQVPYRSCVEGVMHACGHDAHTTTVLGAILALHKLRQSDDKLRELNCRAIFQPAEETNRGALEMVSAGALEGIDVLLGLHMDPKRAVGTIGVRPGDFTADCHELEIEVLGRGAHAARPHEAVDPIATAAQLISSIYLFVPRGTDSQDPVVVTFGQILGGYAPNAIPDKVVVRGTLRTLDRSVSESTIRHIERLIRGAAEASETKIAIRWTSGPPPVKNDPELTRLLSQAGRKILGEGNVHLIHKPSMGGEDFANYLDHARGAMFRLGCSVEPKTAPPLHSPLFDIDENSLKFGAGILAQAALDWHHSLSQ